MSIVIQSLTYLHPDKTPLFENIAASVTKAALVGNNGVGKSTLLQLIAGQLQPASGEIILSEKPYYVPQHLGQYDEYTIAEVLGVATQLKALKAILAGDTSTAHFTALNDEWDVEERVTAALAHWRLQFSPEQPMGLLSGGEKTKVFLAGITLHHPNIVLLDEPSNHLDSNSRELLYEFIKQYNRTLLVVSHDRALLNLLPLTLELSKTGIEVYGGNYDFYLSQRHGKINALQAQMDEQEKTLRQAKQKARDVMEQRQKKEARTNANSDKTGLPKIIVGNLKRQAELSTAKLKDVQQNKLQDLTGQLKETRAQMQEYQALKIGIASSSLHKGKILVDAKEMNFAYGEHALWPSALSFQLRSGDRVRIAGNNGAGKTTLLKIIMGQLLPTKGEIYRAEFTYLYVDQEYAVIDNRLTVYAQLQQYNQRKLEEHELKTLLHHYQFTPGHWDRSCSALSGGEKMKLLLCCLAVSNQSPDMLVLDEPTNNLDLRSQEILTHAIKDFDGTVLVISHDQHFVNEVGVKQTINPGFE
jgi:ATPase subunit of ABC transporter with duplicated ATPase domains